MHSSEKAARSTELLNGGRRGKRARNGQKDKQHKSGKTPSSTHKAFSKLHRRAGQGAVSLQDLPDNVLALIFRQLGLHRLRAVQGAWPLPPYTTLLSRNDCHASMWASIGQYNLAQPCPCCAAVCKRWRALGNHPQFVTHVRPGHVNEAIAAAGVGDTLVLAPGFYQEILLIEKPLRLVGAPGQDLAGRPRKGVVIQSNRPMAVMCNARHALSPASSCAAKAPVPDAPLCSVHLPIVPSGWPQSGSLAVHVHWCDAWPFAAVMPALWRLCRGHHAVAGQGPLLHGAGGSPVRSGVRLVWRRAYFENMVFRAILPSGDRSIIGFGPACNYVRLRACELGGITGLLVPSTRVRTFTCDWLMRTVLSPVCRSSAPFGRCS